MKEMKLFVQEIRKKVREALLMNRSRKLIFDIVLICWIIVAMLFIFFNSTMDYVSSHSASSNITDILVLGNTVERETTENLIRKIAHMIEFAFLGAPVIAFAIHIHQHHKKPVYGFAFFYVLAVAVTDEHIQSFSDRTSSTGDIILDFCGALIGFLIVWLISKLYVTIKRRINKGRKQEVD